MRQWIPICVLLAVVLLSPALPRAQETGGESAEPTGLEYLNAARAAEASGHSLQALFLAGKIAGFSSFIDTTDEDYPPLLDTNSTEYQEALEIIERCSGYLQWHSEIMSNQVVSCYCELDCPQPCLMRISQNGNHLAVIDLDSSINIYDLQTGHLSYTIKQYFEFVHEVEFSFDGSMLSVLVAEEGACNSSLYVYSVNDGELLSIICMDNLIAMPKWEDKSNTLVVPQQDFTFLTINPLEDRLTEISAGNNTYNIIDFTEDQAIIVYKENRFSDIIYIFYSYIPDKITRFTTEHEFCALNQQGPLLASWTPESTCDIWDVETGKLLSTLYSNSKFSRVVWSIDGRRITTTNFDGTICIWDPKTGEILQTLMATPWVFSDICWTPDGQYILYLNQDGFVSRWDASSGDHLTPCNGHQGPVRSVGWSPEGELVVSGGEDGNVCLWDSAIGSLLHSFQGHRGSVYDVEFNHEGKYLASSSLPYEDWPPMEGILIWDVQNESLINELDTDNSTILSISWNPNNNLLAASGENGFLRIWDAISGEVLTNLEGHIQSVVGVTWSPCGQYITSAGEDSRICMWEQSSGILLSTRELPNQYARYISWSSDGKYIAVADVEGTVFVYDADLNLKLTLQPDWKQARTIEWSSDGARLAIGGSTDLQIWDINTQSLLRTYNNDVGFRPFSLSPDGERVVAGGMGLSMWDITGKTQGKFNADILRFIEFDGTEVRFIHPLGNIGEVLSINRQ